MEYKIELIIKSENEMEQKMLNLIKKIYANRRQFIAGTDGNIYITINDGLIIQKELTNE